MASAIIGSLLPSVASIGKKVASNLIEKAKEKAVEKGGEFVKKGLETASTNLKSHWTGKGDTSKQFMDVLESIKETQDNHTGPRISMLASSLKPYISKYAGQVIPQDKVDAIMNKLPDATKVELIEKSIEEEALGSKSASDIDSVIAKAEST